MITYAYVRAIGIDGDNLSMTGSQIFRGDVFIDGYLE